MVIEAIDYVWLGQEPSHLAMKPRQECAFEFETPYHESDYPYFHPAFLWRSATGLTMAAMPRKISFYLIADDSDAMSICIVFLETIAQVSPGKEEPCKLHLASENGTTVIWQQNPVVRGMYLSYFLFDCFGSLQPQPWDSQAYSSDIEKQENIKKLAGDGRWVVSLFFKMLAALTEFNLVGWDERLTELTDMALKKAERQIATTLHSHLDDLHFHQEKAALHIRPAKKLLSQKDEAIYKNDPGIASFLDDFTMNSEYTLRRYERMERKITNTIEMVCCDSNFIPTV